MCLSSQYFENSKSTQQSVLPLPWAVGWHFIITFANGKHLEITSVDGIKILAQQSPAKKLSMVIPIQVAQIRINLCESTQSRPWET